MLASICIASKRKKRTIDSSDRYLFGNTAMKELNMLSPMRREHVPFTRIADLEKAAVMTAALHEICRQAGLAPGSPECHDAAAFIMRLYWNGHRTADELEAALLAYLEAA